ncbi:hypothetical protein [Nostoc flagelliforme]|uniref:hypothetical protein n=1 Tax=Nostoc flagelliforme TaxID=1306274 RepID=UPI0018EFB245
MKKRTFWDLFCLSTILVINMPLGASVPLTRVRRSQVRCEQPIGRIVSKGDEHFGKGSLICEGEKLEVLNGGYIRMLCFSSGSLLNLSSGVISSDKCAKPESYLPNCNPTDVKLCQIRKGGIAEGNKPTVISPYTTSILNPRPEITWTPVRSAISYKIRLSSYEFEWEKVVNQTQLTYPADEKELQPGNAYRIDVFAYKDGYAITAHSRIVNLLSVSYQEEIAQEVKRIKELGLPLDEAVLDIDAIYMSRNLLNETIEILKAQTVTGTRNPSIYRVLGDRYLRVWLPNSAKHEYTIAVELAKSSNNSVELVKAQEGLKLVNFYNQLPTSRKGAQ